MVAFLYDKYLRSAEAPTASDESGADHSDT